ncbi:MAG: hypothetical protein WC906_04095 [Parcubacteria group bacterium]|jgi:hypothetical protein
MQASDIAAQLSDDISTQRFRYPKFLGGETVVPCKGNPSNSGRLKINNSLNGAFKITEIRIRAYGPCDVNGVVPQTIDAITGQQTSFPMGLAVSSAADATQKAESGLTVYIKDAATGRELTDGFMPIENLCAPGYVPGLVVLSPYKLVLEDQKDLYFEFRNRDEAILTVAEAAYHKVEVTLIGLLHDGVGA